MSDEVLSSNRSKYRSQVVESREARELVLLRTPMPQSTRLCRPTGMLSLKDTSWYLGTPPSPVTSRPRLLSRARDE